LWIALQAVDQIGDFGHEKTRSAFAKAGSGIRVQNSL
jgi:hypothetical protein